MLGNYLFFKKINNILVRGRIVPEKVYTIEEISETITELIKENYPEIEKVYIDEYIKYYIDNRKFLEVEKAIEE